MKEIIKSNNIKATEYGIEFTGKPSIKEWHQAVQAVQQINGLCQWYLGDLIVYAESPVTGWGESKYRDLLGSTGYEYQTLANYASVARRFPPSFRESVLERFRSNGNVSFAHFERVQGLEDSKAIYFLDMVQDGGWSVAKLREEIIRQKNGGMLPAPKDSNFEPAEIPDGFVAAKYNDFYIPAPTSVAGEEQYLTCKIELQEWEARLVLHLIKNDPKLVSLAGRLALFLDSA